MSMELPWVSSSPLRPGIYLVAIQLGPAAGVYDFLVWSGSEWETDQQGEIIAHVDAEGLKKALNIVWPGRAEIDFHRKKFTLDDNELWAEE